MTSLQWVLLWTGVIGFSLILWGVLLVRLRRKAKTLLASLGSLRAHLGSGEALDSPRR